MKKITYLFILVFATCISASAEVITVWEGEANRVYFIKDSNKDNLANYNKLMGNEAGQANFSGGDRIRFYYGTFSASSQMYTLDKLGKNLTDIGGPGTVTIKAGETGSYDFMINNAMADRIKENGLDIRFGNDRKFTKIEVIKAGDPENIVSPDPNESFLWQGSTAGSVSIDLRYNKPLLDIIRLRKTIKVYLSNVAKGNKINATVPNTTYTAFTEVLEAGTEAVEFDTKTLSAEIIQAIITNGMMIKRTGNFNMHFATYTDDGDGEQIIIGEDNFGTFYTDKAYIMPEGLAGGIITAADNATGTLTVNYIYKAGATVPAKSALLLKESKQGTLDKYVFTYTTSADTPAEGNMLHGADAVDTKGNTFVAGTDVKYYILSHDKTKTDFGFYWAKDNGVAVAYQAPYAFLAVETSGSNAAPKKFSLGGDGETTGITTVKTETTTGGKVYTLTGAYVGTSTDNLPKGLYIKDGKKVIIK